MTDTTAADDLIKRIADYLTGGGLWNPEFANHMAVRDLLLECRDALRARAASQPPSASQYVLTEYELKQLIGAGDAGFPDRGTEREQREYMAARLAKYKVASQPAQSQDPSRGNVRCPVCDTPLGARWLTQDDCEGQPAQEPSVLGGGVMRDMPPMPAKEPPLYTISRGTDGRAVVTTSTEPAQEPWSLPNAEGNYCSHHPDDPAHGAWCAAPPASQPAQEPDNDKVICPNCCHQFRAIPVNVQQILLNLGCEPPFMGTPEPAQQAEPILAALDWERLAGKQRRALDPEHQWAFDLLYAPMKSAPPADDEAVRLLREIRECWTDESNPSGPFWCERIDAYLAKAKP